MDNPRHRRFIAWFKATYGKVNEESRKKFTRDTGSSGEPPSSQGRVTQLFDENEPFGLLATRSLANCLALDENTFLSDSESSAPIDDGEALKLADLRAIRRINPETYDKMVGQIGLIAEGARAPDRFIRTKTHNGYASSHARSKSSATCQAEKPKLRTAPSGSTSFSEARRTLQSSRTIRLIARRENREAYPGADARRLFARHGGVPDTTSR